VAEERARSYSQPRAVERQLRERPGLGLRRAAGRDLERQQLDLDLATDEQRCGIEVRVPRAGPEVQPLAGDPDPVAAPDALTEHDGDGAEERVGRPHAVAVAHGDVQRAGHGPDEDDRAVGAGSHRVAGLGVVLEAAVARAEGPGRRPEGVGDGRRDRWVVGGWRGVGRGRLGTGGSGGRQRCGRDRQRQCPGHRSGRQGAPPAAKLAPKLAEPESAPHMAAPARAQAGGLERPVGREHGFPLGRVRLPRGEVGAS
jgi:hypothetical protein